MLVTGIKCHVLTGIHNGRAGGPGCGKSFGTNSLRELFEAMGWVHGVQFEIAAMQAVVAAMLDGKTLHKTCGISFRKTTGAPNRSKNNLRWLIIDEISQVSSSLLTQCEKHTSDSIDTHGTYKLDDITGLFRDWGGINVIFVGDFYQLPPADGVALDTIPNALMPESLVSNQVAAYKGLSLMWEGVNVLVELTIQERAGDDWWMEVVNEIRYGRLSTINHAFLHGEPTLKSGSWSHSQQRNLGCEHACETMHGECEHCQHERVRRCRVFNSGALNLTASDASLMNNASIHPCMHCMLGCTGLYHACRFDERPRH